MALKYFTGFESWVTGTPLGAGYGSGTACPPTGVTGSPTVGSTNVHGYASGQSVRFNGNNQYLTWNNAAYGAPGTEFAATFYLYLAALPSSGTPAVFRLAMSSGTAFSLQITSTGQLQAVWTSGTVNIGSALSTGQYYRISLKINRTGTYASHVKIDGSETTGPTSTTVATFGSALDLGLIGTANSMDAYIDDVSFWDALTDYDKYNYTVYGQKPTSDGTHSITGGSQVADDASTAITNSTTDAYLRVNEGYRTSGDTSFIKWQIAGTDKVAVGFTNDADVRTPYAVCFNVGMGAATSKVFSGEMYDGSNAVTLFSSVSIATSQNGGWWFSKATETAPDAGAWSTSKVNSLQLRMWQPSGSLASWFDCTIEVMVNVKYPLTVTADNKSKAYGDANPALTISYSGFQGGDNSSNLTTAPTATCTADTSTHVSASPVAIVPAGGVDSKYDFTYVNGNLTINKATLTVTADNKSKAYGDANPALTIQYSGFVNGETSAVLTTAPTAACTADATTHVSASPVSITVSGGVDDDYSLSYVSGQLTITKAVLTVTPDNKSKTYGDANPALTVGYSGFKNGETSAVLTTAPTASCNADEFTGVIASPVAINASGGVDDDYSFSYVEGYLTITKATLTVTPDDKSRTYGAANPTFTLGYSGWKNGNGVESLTTAPTGACTATGTTPVGTASITASGGVDDDYSFSYATGTLTITKATLTATADNQTMNVGDAVPTLTISYSGFLNGETSAVLDTPPTASTVADGSTAGVFDIIPAGGSDNNYTFSYVNGVLTVSASGESGQLARSRCWPTLQVRVKSLGLAGPGTETLGVSVVADV